MLLYLYDRVHGRRVFVRAADDSGSESDFDDEWEAIDRGPENSRSVCVCVCRGVGHQRFQLVAASTKWVSGVRKGRGGG